jgi:integrase
MSATFRTKRDAQEAERRGQDRVRAKKHGLVVDAGPITYEEMCERYLSQHQVSPVTIRTLKERLRYSRAAFGDVRVRELRPEEISRWNAGLALSATTRGHALRAMRQVLEAGVRWGYLGFNPAGPMAVQMPSAPPKEIRPFESWDEVEAVASEAGRYGALVRFACATGLRPQEWQALEWGDLDFVNRRVRVLRAVQDGQVRASAKTDGSLRTVVLQQRAMDAVRSLPRPLDSHTLVFPSPDGGVVNLSNLRRRVWQPALDTANLDRRPLYEMRHSFATLALSAGAPLEWISKQLGHADTRVTLRHYARFLPAADERALAMLDAFGAHRGGRKADAASDG